MKPQPGETVSRPNILRPGDVVAIPLLGVGYGFGRVHKNATIAILRHHSAELPSAEDAVRHSIAFFTGFGCTRVQSTDWIYLGYVRFANKEEAWPPPVCAESYGEPKVYTILHRDSWREVSKDEVKGMARQVSLSPAGIRHLVLEKIVDSSPSEWVFTGTEWKFRES